jgi:hypothetical protein
MIFYACMKSVLLYGCETWLVTSEIRSKLANRCQIHLKDMVVKNYTK